MENANPFDLNDALRLWRAEFGTIHALSAEDLEELETHLRDRTAALHAQGFSLEDAFHTARQILGSREVLGAEFAKINPQRVWLERGIWMLAGWLILNVLGNLSNLPRQVVSNYAVRSHWDPLFVMMGDMFVPFATVAAGAVLCWWSLRGGSHRLRNAAQWCARNPLLAGVALLLVLQGISRIPRSYYYACLVEWILPSGPLPTPVDQAWIAAVEHWWVAGAFIENGLWAVGVAFLAAYVLRADRRHIALAGETNREPFERVLWLERGLWLLSGAVFARFATRNIFDYGLLPTLWIHPSASHPRLTAHLIGFVCALLVVALGVASIWICWLLMTRCPRLNDRLRPAFRDGPYLTALGATLALNLYIIQMWLWQWLGVRTTGGGPGPVTFDWHSLGWAITQQVLPVAFLLVLLRRRANLIAAV